MAEIDNLSIEISATSRSAEVSIDKLVARLDSLISGLESIGKSANNIGKVSNATKKIKSGFNSTTGSVVNLTKNLSRLYFNVKALTSAFKGLGGSLISAMDYMETSNYWNVSVNKAMSQITDRFGEFGAESAEEYGKYLLAGLEDINKKLTGYTIGESGEALSTGKIGLGVSIEKLMAFQARVTGITSAVGMLGETSIETTKFLSMLVSDLSSLTNTDISSVYNNLISTLIGQSRAGYKFGFDTTNNTLQQLATDLGIEKAVSEMEQAEKMQLRVIALLRQSEIAWTDMAVTVDSAANQYRIFGEQTENLSRTFGNLFLPIVQNALPWINGATIALNNLLTTLGYQIFGDTWLEDLQNGVSDGATNDFTDLEDVLEETTDASEKLKKSLRGFDELKTISTGSNSVINALVGGSTGLDLTDIISAELGEYTSVWNEAFANIETESEKIAERLTENFGEIAETFERLEPAIVGVGTALITYGIAGKIGTLVTALGGLSGPAAGIIVGAGLLAGLGTAIHNLYSELKIADLETRFGDITLSAKELEEVAKHIIDNKNLDKISKLLSEIGEVADIEAKIQDSVDALNELNWKVSIGMELTEEEQSTYKAAISNYIASMESLIGQEHYSVSLGIGLFLGNSEETQEISSVVNEFYDNNKTKLAELGTKLNNAVTEAFNDDILDIDEVKAITKIQADMAEIQNQLSSSQTMAKLKLLEADYSGAELTPETYRELQKKRQELLNEYETDLNESLTYTIAGINVAYKAQYDKATTEKAKQEIKGAWDDAVDEIIGGKETMMTDMLLNSLAFDYNTISDTFGSELDSTFKEVFNQLGTYARKYASGAEWAESAIPQLMTSITQKMKKYAGNEGAENFGEILELMTGSGNLEETAQSLYESTGAIPQAMADALISSYALETISGNMDAMYKLMFLSADSKDRDEVLELMKKNGINIPTFFSDGIIEVEHLATDSISDMLENVGNIVADFSLYDEMYKIGEEAVKGWENGLKDGIALMPTITISNGMVSYDGSSLIPHTSKAESSKIETNAYSFGNNSIFNKVTDTDFFSKPFSQEYIKDSVLKELNENMRNLSLNGVGVDVNISVEPNENEIVKTVINGINQRTKATGKTPIALQY